MSKHVEDHQVSFLSANVYQKNRSFDELLKLIYERQPDFIFLVETDNRWKTSLEPLQEHWPYSVLHPQDNSCGFLFFSKYPIEDFKVKHLVDERVPSLFATCRIDKGSLFEFIGLHPRPPRPVEGHSHERDGELIQVANYVRKSKRNFIVAGDLNDVAWSHSTRMFRRVSGLWDPRIGRGIYATFPKSLPYLRFPLDHFFHSSGFRLVRMERLGDVGSDHLPIYLRLAHVDQEGETNEISDSLKDESRRYQQKAQEWDGPNQVITPDRV
ncbi:endonuclease/exonuclease/phosphatase family protein [Pseudobacteriovorax antillogorgiicola]|uniref:Uncharacterized conserved protein YafD, endonuclease/exonuclease/phosphatase (EEP) superfamily n=1 Tax=Pseudobacteriovorax antillogorgiicola TaxID=1513793 RepID=A0A1Y6CHT7_9BACT|nr:endonuclease/exonuclease/phosphatase family protein [Pseudobacteriovorax antillogorgiicola]TCS47007.1 endonuclease/exonuclease/phosphatase (EEP) superfamily protein YafD [Pseudobacteriovorax antillogorgiicola]SMF65012.1 Uncharacterized conserved protein YafD, endonuclease/exonuclease/phosphatase (EEP) superfamily [Pseudobacteriovorax antillogorgiicola]